MIKIAFDTSTPYCNVALGEGNKILSEVSYHLPQKHQERLLPIIDSLLKKNSLGILDIDCYVVGIGPGSYTGLRIGISTARALAQGTGKKIIPISSMDAIAFNFINKKGITCIAIDGKQSEIYLAFYETKNSLKRTSKYLVVKPEEVSMIMKKNDEKITVAGDGLKAYGNLFKGKNVEKSEESLWIPRASNLLNLSHQREAKEFNEVTPLYLRLSHAEENKKRD